MATMPKTHYAKTGHLSIAFQVTGNGPIDIVMVPGLVSHLELAWEFPAWSDAFRRYGAFARLIRFDKRGTGLSDRAAESATLEERMDDVRAVMDAANSASAALVGISEGGPMSILFAASYPERTRALVLVDSFARLAADEDYPWGMSEEMIDRLLRYVASHWGDGSFLSRFFPTVQGNEDIVEALSRVERYSASPHAVADICDMIFRIDVRPVLQSLRVPTLVIHRSGDPMIPSEHGRFLAQGIPGARYVELESGDHASLQRTDTEVEEIEEFLTGARHSEPTDRVLATVLFSDIVGSTQIAAQLGDRKWRDALEFFYELTRRQLERFRGQQVKTTGDGILATFDGPARAVRCTCAIRDGVRSRGLHVRSGLHTGEIESIGDDIGGIAVHIGQRVCALASPDEVLVSRTVADLVAGSGLEFADRGEHELRGVPGSWKLFAVKG